MMSKQNLVRRSFIAAVGRAVMVASFALFGLSACGGDDGPSGGVPGTYTLRTHNGEDLPYIDFEDATFKSEVIAETIVINANGTFTATTRYRDTEEGVAPDVYDSDFNGTWEKDGATITFEIDGSFIDGILNGNTITITQGQDVGVYRKG